MKYFKKVLSWLKGLWFWEQLVKNQFWFLTSLETFSVGSVLFWADLVFDDHLPRFLVAFNVPFIPFWMVIFGGYSLIFSIKKMNVIVVFSNLVIVAFISISSILEIFAAKGAFVVLPAVVSAYSLILVLRILFEASKLKLPKSEREDHE